MNQLLFHVEKVEKKVREDGAVSVLCVFVFVLRYVSGDSEKLG